MLKSVQLRGHYSRKTTNVSADVVRIVFAGDTHGQHRTLHVPSGDFLIHTGDFTLLNRSREEVRDCNAFLISRTGGKWSFLGITISSLQTRNGGIGIWCSPLTPSNFESFGATSEADCARISSQIPDGTDLVITHGPPFGILVVAERQRQSLSSII
jgi:hypothetical protein